MKNEDNNIENEDNIEIQLIFDSFPRTFIGFESCKSNVLAEIDDSVVKTLCYDN